MKITLFAKTAHTKDGKAFIRYIGRMTNNAGKEVSMTVRVSGKAPAFDQDK